MLVFIQRLKKAAGVSYTIDCPTPVDVGLTLTKRDLNVFVSNINAIADTINPYYPQKVFGMRPESLGWVPTMAFDGIPKVFTAESAVIAQTVTKP